MSVISRIFIAFATAIVIVNAGCAQGSAPLSSSTAHSASGPAGVATPDVMQSEPPADFVEFQVPTASSEPDGIALGADHDIWFTELAGNNIGTITETGAITEYRIPTPNSGPSFITPGVANDLWFTESTGDKVGDITVGGAISEYAVPTAGSVPFAAVLGPDGNVWFTENAGNKIGRLVPGGGISEWALPHADSQPAGITVGPDGAIWFAEANAARVGRIPLSGKPIKEYAIPNPAEYITTAIDGDVFFSIPIDHSIGKMTPNGVLVAEYFVPVRPSEPWGVFGGSVRVDIWYVDRALNAMMSFNTQDHSLAIFDVPTASSDPVQTAFAPDNNLWFTEQAGNKIGVYVRYRQTDTPSSLSFNKVGQMRSFSVTERKYIGDFTAGGCNPSVATVSGSPGTTFYVTAKGNGSCSITVADPYQNTSLVPVTVNAH